jgi:hypothetical protein
MILLLLLACQSETATEPTAETAHVLGTCGDPCDTPLDCQAGHICHDGWCIGDSPITECPDTGDTGT